MNISPAGLPQSVRARNAIAVLVAGVLVNLCGCSPQPAQSGTKNEQNSLTVSTGGFATCTILEAPAKGIVTGYHIKNKGTEPIALTSIHMTESTGLEFLDSVVLPEYAGIGTMSYPLRGKTVTEMWWDRRKPVKGYVLKAGAGAEIELAVGLEKGVHRGSFTAFVIDYVDSSGAEMSAPSVDTQLDILADGECEDW